MGLLGLIVLSVQKLFALGVVGLAEICHASGRMGTAGPLLSS